MLIKTAENRTLVCATDFPLTSSQSIPITTPVPSCAQHGETPTGATLPLGRPFVLYIERQLMNVFWTNQVGNVIWPQLRNYIEPDLKG